MHDGHAPPRVCLAHVYGRVNMLPWRPPWVAQRWRLLRLGVALLLMIVLLVVTSFYALAWQRQHYISWLQKGLFAQLEGSQQQLQPMRNLQSLWLYKQAAIVESAQLRQQSRRLMQQLLVVQTMLQKIDAQAKSLLIQGTKVEVSLVSSRPWEQLQSEWWLPESGRIRQVKQQRSETGISQWLLQVDVGN